MGKSRRTSEGQYLPLPYAQLKSDAWRSLSGSAVRLWLELHTRYNGGNNGALTLSYAEAGELLGMGKATVQRSYAELVAKGFLTLEREGNWYRRRAHEWRLTTKPMQKAKGKEPASHDWRNFRPPKKTERGSAAEPSCFAVVPFENPSPRSGSKSEPVRAKSRP
jgi:DNA-binding transcriptional ArsR family regulator